MNDRFKFRAWDTKEKQMYYDAEKTYDNLRGHFGFSDFDDLIEEHNKNVVLEQCTGLKDKNGTLIYEGDILEDKYSCIIQIVYQKNAMFQAIQKNGIKGAEFCTGYSLEYNYIKNSKVIGNIHENKGLLDD
jgi:uncharacterized phage protein (TIGR01671 family)